MSGIANTPSPPYYAVIFSSVRTDGDHNYGAMADRMVELAAQQEGFLGIESAREDVGITVSYWASEEAIRNRVHWGHYRHWQTELVGKFGNYLPVRVELMSGKINEDAKGFKLYFSKKFGFEARPDMEHI